MTKKMGGLGKLSQFSGIKRQEDPVAPPEPTPPPAPTLPPPSTAVEPNVEEVALLSPKEKLVTINIKISRSQQEWLTNAARMVRDNNLEPVPPGERVYPQHLIVVAIELLQMAEVDWSQVRNVEELRKGLNII